MVRSAGGKVGGAVVGSSGGAAGNAKTLAIVSVLVAGGLATAADFGKGELPPLRIYTGVAFAGFVLAIMAELSPELSTAFSLLVLLSSVFVWGGDGLTAVLHLINRTTQPKKVPA